VNNAGIAPGKTDTDVESAEELKKNLLEPTDEKEWLDVYQTNVVGPFLMSTAFLPLIQKSTETHKGYSGTIVNISSISGHIRISQNHFSYNASKGATIHLNKMLASEIAKNGIKVGLPAQRPGNDRDMAAAILFVVGCQYLNGQTVTVDGGYSIQVGN
jgi:NAD(P)-dependent dehydrogenase (short-subunit alcohol dehydrogenase family)